MIISANKKLLSFVATVSAAPTPPSSVKHAVPIIKPIINEKIDSGEIDKSKPINGEAIAIGNDFVSQWAVIFPSTAINSRFGVIIICSSDPSL